ncbi:MAG: hypothetical protein GDA53_11450 [Rhodobacteraceae bacterium]|nr:hypothetical protein [Paracoccaceae bacterium]
MHHHAVTRAKVRDFFNSDARQALTTSPGCGAKSPCRREKAIANPSSEGRDFSFESLALLREPPDLGAKPDQVPEYDALESANKKD